MVRSCCPAWERGQGALARPPKIKLHFAYVSVISSTAPFLTFLAVSRLLARHNLEGMWEEKGEGWKEHCEIFIPPLTVDIPVSKITYSLKMSHYPRSSESATFVGESQRVLFYVLVSELFTFSSLSVYTFHMRKGQKIIQLLFGTFYTWALSAEGCLVSRVFHLFSIAMTANIVELTLISGPQKKSF